MHRFLKDNDGKNSIVLNAIIMENLKPLKHQFFLLFAISVTVMMQNSIKERSLCLIKNMEEYK